MGAYLARPGKRRAKCWQSPRKENSVGKTKKKAKEGLGKGANAAELFTVEQLTEISQNRDPVANDLAGDVAALIPEMR